MPESKLEQRTVAGGATRARQYLLAEHVHLCVTDDYVVLLDLKRDKYLALSDAQARALAPLVSEWPWCEGRSVSEGSSEGQQGGNALTDSLMENGLLTVDRRLGKSAAPVRIEPPLTPLVPTVLDYALYDDGSARRPRVRTVDVANVFIAYLSAAWAIRRRSLEHIVRRVKERKYRSGVGSVAMDLGAARSLVSAFRLIRPFVFSAREGCLLDSFTLVEFLARYRIFPDWVFGVRTGPFGAHCWVQASGAAFNDTPDHVRLYTPIMTV